MSEKRHRLTDSEIPEVINGLRLRLVELLAERKESEKAEVAFKCLRRLTRNKLGRPKYGDFSWDFLEYYLDSGLEEDTHNQLP